MFTLGGSALAPHIVSLLAQSPFRTASQILDHLKKSVKSCTIQAVYKELRKLQHALVVTKNRKTYSLSLAWLADVSLWTQSTIDAYSSPENLSGLLPTEGESVKWRFNDMLALDRFSAQLFLAMLRSANCKQIYHWVPHPWFALLHLDLSLSYLRFIKQHKIQGYMIIGGRTKTDLELTRAFNRTWYQLSNATCAFEKRMNTYISVVGPYVMTTRYEPPTVKAIENLFANEASNKTIHSSLLPELLSQRNTSVVKVVNNNLKSAQLQRQFQQHFCRAR